MKKIQIALQVFSIRDEAERDFEKSMEQVKKMGYAGVELAGLYSNSPEKVRDCLKSLELEAVSAHIPYEEFMADLPGVVSRYAIIGCSYAAIPYLPEECRYGGKRFAKVMENIPIIAKECRKAGITLLYHNHDFEFARTKEGDYVLDSMYEQIPKKDLQTELDTCWVKKVGEDPVAYIRKYKGRCPVIHVKDFIDIPSFDFCRLGYGLQDFEGIMNEAEADGCEWAVVEQDTHSRYSSMEDAMLSRDYLKTIGW